MSVPTTAEELAAELQLHTGALERLLDWVRALGLLAKEMVCTATTPLPSTISIAAVPLR
ncbi:MAG: hypothetical protein WDO73_07925 [Ignavibacteriota bacterium]